MQIVRQIVHRHHDVSFTVHIHNFRVDYAAVLHLQICMRDHLDGLWVLTALAAPLSNKSAIVAITAALAFIFKSLAAGEGLAALIRSTATTGYSGRLPLGAEDEHEDYARVVRAVVEFVKGPF